MITEGSDGTDPKLPGCFYFFIGERGSRQGGTIVKMIASVSLIPDGAHGGSLILEPHM